MLYVKSHHLHFAVGAAAVMAVLFTFATSREPSAPSPAFAERWNAVPVRDVLLSRPVRTLPIVQPAAAVSPALPEIDGFLQVPMPLPKTQDKPPDTPQRIKSADNSPPEKSPRIVARGEVKGPDICRGKGRIYTRGGKSWRCRR